MALGRLDSTLALKMHEKEWSVLKPNSCPPPLHQRQPLNHQNYLGIWPASFKLAVQSRSRGVYNDCIGFGIRIHVYIGSLYWSLAIGPGGVPH